MGVRRPKGYVGKDHETIGSDILAVLATVKLANDILGADMVAKLEAVEADGWYPIAWLLELMETLEAKVGRFALLRMGRKLFKLSHEARVREVAKSAKDIVYGVDAMYHHANRGTGIGGWKVLKFEPGHAELQKTTPHHCAMEEGIVLEALAAMGVHATIEQSECFRKGAPSCVYVVRSAVVDERWGPTDKKPSSRR